MNKAKELITLCEATQKRARIKLQNVLSIIDFDSIKFAIESDLNPKDIISQDDIFAASGKGWTLTVDRNENTITYEGPESNLEELQDILTNFGFEFNTFTPEQIPGKAMALDGVINLDQKNLF